MTERPRSRRSSERPGRHIPAEVRRDVWARDGGRCAYVSADGHRCEETHFLEYHHREPYARGGAHDASNIELRCRAHNQHWGRPTGVRDACGMTARRTRP